MLRRSNEKRDRSRSDRKRATQSKPNVKIYCGECWGWGWSRADSSAFGEGVEGPRSSGLKVPCGTATCRRVPSGIESGVRPASQGMDFPCFLSLSSPPIASAILRSIGDAKGLPFHSVAQGTCPFAPPSTAKSYNPMARFVRVASISETVRYRTRHWSSSKLTSPRWWTPFTMADHGSRIRAKSSLGLRSSRARLVA